MKEILFRSKSVEPCVCNDITVFSLMKKIIQIKY